MSTKLSLFWLLYMAGLGIFFPYYGLYLQLDLQLSASEVGLVLAVLPLTGILCQPLWGQLADRTGSRRLTLALICTGVALGNLCLGLASNLATALIATAGLALFSTAALPLATAVSLAATTDRGARAFAPIRMWGTVGFLISVLMFPHLLELVPARQLPWSGLGWMFPATAVLSLLAAVVAIRLPKTPALTLRAGRGEARLLLSHRPVVALMVVAFFAQLAMQGPIHLFPLLITGLGGDADVIGHMWIFMLLLEIPLIGFLGKSLQRIGPRGLLIMGLIAESVRWAVCAWSTEMAVIQSVQLLHGVGVAGVLVGAPLYLEASAPASLRSTGQSLVSIAYGFGSILSIAGGGWLFERAGSAALYGLAGGLAIALATAVALLLPAPYRPVPGPTTPSSPRVD